MKSLSGLYIFLILFASSSITAQIFIPEYVTRNKVKEIHLFRTDREGKKELDISYYFDSLGRVVKAIEYRPFYEKGNLVDSALYIRVSYDSLGRKSEEVETNQLTHKRIKYTYVSEGDLKIEEQTDGQTRYRQIRTINNKKLHYRGDTLFMTEVIKRRKVLYYNGQGKKKTIVKKDPLDGRVLKIKEKRFQGKTCYRRWNRTFRYEEGLPVVQHFHPWFRNHKQSCPHHTKKIEYVIVK